MFKRKRKRSNRYEEGKAKKKRKKPRKKLKLVLNKLGKGALAVVKSPMFKTALGLLKGPAMAAAAEQPELIPFIDKAFDMAENIGDKDKAKAALKDSTSKAKDIIENVGKKVVSDQPDMNPQLQALLNQALQSADQSNPVKDIGQSAQTQAKNSLSKIKPTQKIMENSDLDAAMAFYQKYKNMLPS